MHGRPGSDLFGAAPTRLPVRAVDHRPRPVQLPRLVQLGQEYLVQPVPHVDALNLLQRCLDSEPAGYQELSINIDTGGLAARRILAKLAAR